MLAEISTYQHDRVSLTTRSFSSVTPGFKSFFQLSSPCLVRDSKELLLLHFLATDEEYSKPPDIDFSQFAGSLRSFDSKMADRQKRYILLQLVHLVQLLRALQLLDYNLYSHYRGYKVTGYMEYGAIIHR